ncbi:hypothetical protein HAZT_HAZT007980 [Hyalella azteca]|uniref:Uncharacterized protein n=1 Tax=Hyalella azteca TaxID=294128 RepID=A0A6A0H4C7_HYAAZ|nr:hypothetical protein HAZT_HAZT007980 [Hyalella azteca]
MKRLLTLLLAVMAAMAAQNAVLPVSEKPDTEAFLKVLYNDSYPLEPIKIGNFKIPDNLTALAYGNFFPCWGKCTDGLRFSNTVEMIRLFQSLLINWDKKMCYMPSKTYAKARTTTLNEELGQVQYIFSDKTGTLTQNVMTFNKCSINGVSYGDVDDDLEGYDQPIDFSGNPYSEPSFVFYDRKLTVDLRTHDPHVETFFLLLALCHTVMPQEEDGKLVYQAQSPDESALVSAARNFGFVFKSRTPNSITAVINGEEQTHELLCILDFNNVRKRMSVVIRYDGKLRLFCKGADSIIFERLRADQEEIKSITCEHIDVSLFSVASILM